MWRDIIEKNKEEFNKLATHPLQAYEWGEFRKKTGIQVIRKGFFINDTITQAFQLTIHKIPHSSFTIGYLPKGTMPTQELLKELCLVAKEQKCIFIQLEPNARLARHSGEHSDSRISYENKQRDPGQARMTDFGFVPAAHPLFTKYTFQLDLTKSEEELLKNMHPKTRYNIKVAQKHDVKVLGEDSPEAFEKYLALTKETTNRQGFFSHTPHYHTTMWETLKTSSKDKRKENELQAHLFVARYNNIPLTTWILFTFHDTLYYPYGASSREHRDVMAQNAMMWEAIKFGKKLGLKKFDMWGSLGPSADTHDSWYGFHRFKQGYNPELVEFVGSYDLVINPFLYQVYKIADMVRWTLLKMKK